MTAHFHAIVWIDHVEARVFHVGLTGDDEIVLHPHLPTRHLHHKAGSIGSGHAAPDKEFLGASDGSRQRWTLPPDHRPLQRQDRAWELHPRSRSKDRRSDRRRRNRRPSERPRDDRLCQEALSGPNPTRRLDQLGPSAHECAGCTVRYAAIGPARRGTSAFARSARSASGRTSRRRARRRVLSTPDERAGRSATDGCADGVKRRCDRPLRGSGSPWLRPAQQSRP